MCDELTDLGVWSVIPELQKGRAEGGAEGGKETRKRGVPLAPGLPGPKCGEKTGKRGSGLEGGAV